MSFRKIHLRLNIQFKDYTLQYSINEVKIGAQALNISYTVTYDSNSTNHEVY